MVKKDPLDELDQIDFEGPGTGATAPKGGPTLLDWAGYTAASIRRQPWLVAGIVAACLVVVVAYYSQKTTLYRVEARIFAQRQQALPSIIRPAGLDDAPTRAAPEFIRRRENLLAMIKAANLKVGGAGTATQPTLATRFLTALGLGPRAKPAGDPMDALVLSVDTALHIGVLDGTIILEVDWPVPLEAFQLAQAALQTFLEGRQLQEVTAIDDSITLLEERLEKLRKELDRAVDEARRSRRDQAIELDDARRAGAAPGPAPQASEELLTLKSRLEAKERAVRDVEEFRRRRLLELQAQLDAQRAVYSDAHPAVINLRADLEAISRESPLAAALREEERRLRQEYTARLALEDRRRPATAGQPLPPRLGVGGAAEEPANVRDLRSQYQRMAERLTAAQIELDAARAAFRYRYTVSRPAQVPTEPFSPNPRKIFGLGILGSLFMGAFSALALELWRGRIVERWQLERQLKLPILGELEKK